MRKYGRYNKVRIFKGEDFYMVSVNLRAAFGVDLVYKCLFGGLKINNFILR